MIERYIKLHKCVQHALLDVGRTELKLNELKLSALSSIAKYLRLVDNIGKGCANGVVIYKMPMWRFRCYKRNCQQLTILESNFGAENGRAQYLSTTDNNGLHRSLLKSPSNKTLFTMIQELYYKNEQHNNDSTATATIEKEVDIISSTFAAKIEARWKMINHKSGHPHHLTIWIYWISLCASNVPNSHEYM